MLAFGDIDGRAGRGMTAIRGMIGHRAAIGLLAVLVLAGCAVRPLTPNERAFAADVIGPALDTDKVRVAESMGLTPLPASSPRPSEPLLVRSAPRKGFCDRTAPEAVSGPPPAWALYNRVHLVPEIYHPDLAAGWPEAARLPEALVLAHELVHVWQWQNRRRTGYHPVRAGLEGFLRRDPYFYVPEDRSRFLDYGYEQQAALLEDYLCYALYDPANPRRVELRRILSPYFPLDRLDRRLGQ